MGELRAILDEWRTVTGLDRKTDDALWKRYSAARETFNRRRGSLSPNWTASASAPARPRNHCARSEEKLSDSTDWAGTAATFRDLLAQWKAAGPGRQGCR